MKKIITFITLCIFIISLVICYLYKDQKVSVLGYHSFVEDKYQNDYNNSMILNLTKFEEQLKFLKKFNYKTLTLEEFYCWKQGECDIPRKSVLITMDDGYASNYYLAFPLLKEYDMNAVVFYVGDYIANTEDSIENDPTSFMSINDIKNSKEEYPNIEFASHSYRLHENGSVESLSYEELDADIKSYKELNESQFYAYPFGHHNANMIEALKNNDYKMAFTFGPDKEHRKASKDDDDYKIPRLNISSEMPLLKFILRIILPF